jgi:hypothetical protein
MFEIARYNWKMHRLLRLLAKQRVRVVHQPGDVWVLEYAVKDTEENQGLIQTCRLRGWVELLHESVLHVGLNADGTIPTDVQNTETNNRTGKLKRETNNRTGKLKKK